MSGVIKALIAMNRQMEEEARKVASRLREEVRLIDDQIAELRQGPKIERPRCGARTRAGGECEAPSMKGGARCRMHGGGGFDVVRVDRLILQSDRRRAMEALRQAEALAGQRRGGFRWKIPSGRR